MFRRLFFLSFTIILAACSARPFATPTPPLERVDVEEQDVYAFLLQKMYRNGGYVIMATTFTNLTGIDNTAQTIDYVLQNMHGVDTKTVDSFRRRNDTTYPIRSDMDLGNPYILLTQAERNILFSQNQSGWVNFYNHFPNAPGITMVSRVGFNAALDEALVYFGTQSNWLVGAGYYFYLKKVNSKWSIDQQVMTWVS